MGVLRNAIADTDPDQGTVQGDLSRRRRQKVLTAQHMGDPHQRIIDRVDQGIQRISIRPRECEVRHRSGRERRLTPDQIEVAGPACIRQTREAGRSQGVKARR